MLTIVKLDKNPKRKRKAKKSRVKIIRVKKNPSSAGITWNGAKGKTPVGEYVIKKGGLFKKKYGVMFITKGKVKNLKKKMMIGTALSPVKAKAIAERHYRYVDQLKRNPKPVIIKVKKNPKRKRIETMLVGIIVRGRKSKRVYYTGRGFSYKKEDAKIFPGNAAKMEAKIIEPRLPHQIARLYMETI